MQDWDPENYNKTLLRKNFKVSFLKTERQFQVHGQEDVILLRWKLSPK